MRPSPPPPAPLTLGDSLASAARAGGGGVADRAVARPWAELEAASARLACGLLGLRLQRGDCIAVVDPDGADWPLLFYAAARIGVAVLPLRQPPRALRAGQLAGLEYALAHSATKVVFTPQQQWGVDLIAALARLVPRLPALRHVIAVDGQGLNGLAALAATALEPGPLSLAQRKVVADDIALLVYGHAVGDRPCATAISHRGLLAGAAAPPAAAITLPRQILPRAGLPPAAAGRAQRAAWPAGQR